MFQTPLTLPLKMKKNVRMKMRRVKIIHKCHLQCLIVMCLCELWVCDLDCVELCYALNHDLESFVFLCMCDEFKKIFEFICSLVF
jgi:hypothetical protein